MNFYGVDADRPGDVWVSGGGGMIFHWNGSAWIPEDTGENLKAVAYGNPRIAVGASGTLLEQ